jgi:flagellar biosynthetic protein FliP
VRNLVVVRLIFSSLLVLSASPAEASSRPGVTVTAQELMQLAQATPAPSTGMPVQPIAAPSINVPVQPAAIPLDSAPAQQSTPPLVNAPTQPIAAPPVTLPPQLNTMPSDPNELRVTGLGGGSAQWTIVILLTFLTLIPSVLICMTPFARLLIVFHFLRQALGLQTTPSNQTLIGLSVIMTFFLMQPIGVTIYHDSVVPLQAGTITALDAVTRAAVPMRQFMSHYVREKDVALFLEMAKEPRPADINDVSFRVLLPAYILSELKAGFQIGAVLFLPFLVVDMVVASITTSVGMMQLPPVVISTPLKLLLFLMVDGWHLLIGALMRSFN